MIWKLAARNILRNTTRTFITLLVISSGIIAMILGGGFIEDTVTQLRETTIRDVLGHLRIYRKGFLEEGFLHPFDYLITEPENLLSQIRSRPHVRTVGLRLSVPGLMSTGEVTAPFIMQAFDPQLEPAYTHRSQIVAGDVIEGGKNFDVLVGKGLAKALNAHVGDGLVLLGHTQRGAINAVDVNVRGIFTTGTKEYDESVVRAPLALAQKLLRSSGAQMILVFLDHTEQVDSVVQSLSHDLHNAGSDYEVKPWYQLEEADEVQKLENVYRSIFRVSKIIIFLVVTLGIMNTMNMAVLERIGEIGTLMALGTKQSAILELFLWEGAFLGIIGALLGSLLGYGLALLISWIGIPMPTPPGYTLVWVARIACSAGVLVPPMLMAIITSVISSVLPAIKASRLEVGESLRHNI